MPANPLFTTESEDNDIAIVKTLKDVAADLLRGEDPTIPEEDFEDAEAGDRHKYAMECAAEMLIELIKSVEFQDHYVADIDRRTGKCGLSFRVEG